MRQRAYLALGFLALSLALFGGLERTTLGAMPVVDVDAKMNWYTQLARMQKTIDVAINTRDYVKQQMYFIKSWKESTAFNMTSRAQILGRCDRSTVWQPVYAHGRQVNQAYFNLMRRLNTGLCLNDYSDRVQKQRTLVDLFDGLNLHALNAAGLARDNSFEANKNLKELWRQLRDTSEEGRAMTASLQKIGYANGLIATQLRDMQSLQADMAHYFAIQAMQQREDYVEALLAEEAKRRHFDASAKRWTALE